MRRKWSLALLQHDKPLLPCGSRFFSTRRSQYNADWRCSAASFCPDCSMDVQFGQNFHWPLFEWWMRHWFRFIEEFSMTVFGIPVSSQTGSSWRSTVWCHSGFFGLDIDSATCSMWLHMDWRSTSPYCWLNFKQKKGGFTKLWKTCGGSQLSMSFPLHSRRLEMTGSMHGLSSAVATVGKFGCVEQSSSTLSRRRLHTKFSFTMHRFDVSLNVQPLRSTQTLTLNKLQTKLFGVGPVMSPLLRLSSWLFTPFVFTKSVLTKPTMFNQKYVLVAWRCFTRLIVSYSTCVIVATCRNLCWDRIHGARQREEPIHVGLPAHLAGVCRLPAIRKHHGPLRPTSFQRATLQVRRELSSLMEEGEADFAWWDPMSLPDLTLALCEQFQRSLAEWIDLEDPQVVDFHNLFFNCICSSGMPEFQAARIFIHWIEHDFSEHVLPDDHLDKADLLERSYMTMLDDIHIWSLRMRRKQLQDQLEWLQQSSPPVPGHQVRPDNRRRARGHCIAAAYAAMGAEEHRRRAWRTLNRPTRTPTPEQGPYFIVHLYSGRPRSQDFHEAMQSLVHSTTSTWASSLWVVSTDTAIREDMNVHSETVWSWLLTAARSGRILGLLLGPPCETWSGARFGPRRDAQGQLLRGPRPLRHSDSCWGLERLSLKELQQISVGNCLFLRGLWLCIPIAIGGGAVLLEHPAPPVQMERPSIFRTAMVTFLLRHGWMFRRHTFQQWHHGSPAVNPTSLLYANNPIVAVLDELADPTAVKPAGTLIGVDDAGNYKTAVAKEYPANLCRCFATSIWRRIVELPLRPGDAPDALATEFIHASARVEPDQTMKPDYQPRGWSVI